MATLDRQARDRTTLLTKSAVATGDTAVLEPLVPWVSTQQTGLTKIANRLPSGRAKDATTSSLWLVQRVLVRVVALSPSIGCACMSTGRSDDLGPLPCGINGATGSVCPLQAATPSSSTATSSTHTPQPSRKASTTPSTSPSGDGGGTQSPPPPLPPVTPPRLSPRDRIELRSGWRLYDRLRRYWRPDDDPYQRRWGDHGWRRDHPRGANRQLRRYRRVRHGRTEFRSRGS